MKGGEKMNSNVLDLIASSQLSNRSNKSYNTKNKANCSKSFEDILSSNQQIQDKFNSDGYNKKNDNRIDDIKNTDKDKDYMAGYLNKPSICKSEDSCEKINSDTNKAENQAEIDNNVENLEIDVKAIEKTVENILNLIEQLSKIEDVNNVSEEKIKILTTALTELLTKIEAVKGNNLEQGAYTKLEGMLTELMSSLDKFVDNKELTVLDVPDIVNIKDVLDKLKVNNTNKNNLEVNMSSNTDDSKVVLMNQKENSQGKANAGSVKSFDKQENDLVPVNSNSKDTTLNSANTETKILINENKILVNESKILINENVMNDYIQQETVKVQSHIKNDSVKLYDVDKNSVIKQIVEKVKVDVKGENSEIKIKLKPDFLGEMCLKLSMEKGVICAKAVVQDYQVKQLIESNLSHLRNNLEEQGINITDFEVFVGDDSSFERQGMNWNSQNRRRFNNIKIEKNEDKYESYLEEVVQGHSITGLDELQNNRSSINLMA